MIVGCSERVAGREWARMRLERAAERRVALAAAGLATYVLGVPGLSNRILCVCCGLPSSNPNDIAERYCGFCHQFHNERVAVAQWG